MRVNWKLTVGVLALVFVLVSCGSNRSSTPPSSFTPVNAAGQWEIQGQDSTGNVTVVETNFANNSGNSIFASAANVIVVEGTAEGSSIALNNLGLSCDAGQSGFDSLDATFTSATEANFTVSDQGPSGSYQVTGTINFNTAATSVTSGTYSAPAACGFTADSGSISGVKIQPFNGTYSGMLNNGADSIIVTVTEDASNYSFTASGTDNGAPLNVTGSAYGGAWQASGTDAGQSISVVGVYDPTGNDFLIYSYPDLTFEGYLYAGSNPATGAVKPHTFVGRK